MQKKKVLFISYLYPPIGGGGVQRSLKFVKYLSRMDWDITIVTVDGNVYDVYDYSLMDEAQPENTTIIRASLQNLKKNNSKNVSHNTTNIASSDSISSSRSKILKQYLRWMKQLAFQSIHIIPDPSFNWYFPALKAIRKIAKNTKFDIIYSTTLPIVSHFIAMRLKKNLNIPWVADFRDLWTDNYYGHYLLPSKKVIDNFFEKRLLSYADLVIGATPKLVENLKSKCSNAKVVLLTNGFDFEEYQVDYDKRESKNKLCFSYTGRIYEQRNSSVLWNAIYELIKEGTIDPSMIEFVFAGPPLPDNMIRDLQKFSLQNIVKYIGYIDSVEVKRLQMNSDILLLIEPSIDAIPAKFYEYLVSGTFILSIIPPGNFIYEITEKAGNGICVPFSKDYIKKAIMECYERWKRDGRLNLHVNHDYVMSFSRQRITNRLSEYMRELTG